jgi:hypothetical protein
MICMGHLTIKMTPRVMEMMIRRLIGITFYSGRTDDRGFREEGI